MCGQQRREGEVGERAAKGEHRAAKAAADGTESGNRCVASTMSQSGTSPTQTMPLNEAPTTMQETMPDGIDQEEVDVSSGTLV